MGHFSGLIGIFTLLFIAFLLSENKKSINIKTVSLGLALQSVFAIFILKTPF
jgi:CNT family concentrative nucleoside transporter